MWPLDCRLLALTSLLFYYHHLFTGIDDNPNSRHVPIFPHPRPRESWPTHTVGRRHLIFHSNHRRIKHFSTVRVACVGPLAKNNPFRGIVEKCRNFYLFSWGGECGNSLPHLPAFSTRNKVFINYEFKNYFLPSVIFVFFFLCFLLVLFSRDILPRKNPEVLAKGPGYGAVLWFKNKRGGNGVEPCFAPCFILWFADIVFLLPTMPATTNGTGWESVLVYQNPEHPTQHKMWPNLGICYLR